MEDSKSPYFNADQIDAWMSNSKTALVPNIQLGQALPELERMQGQIYEALKYQLEQLVEYKELMMGYTCAMREIETKFEVLNTEFKVRYQRNPIAHISSRLKKTRSLIEKLERKNLPFELPVIEREIHDIAGLRIICSYIDDIYALSDALLKQDDVELVRMKDYIKSPKPNGYRSLHLIVRVPVFFSNQRKMIEVEVQIRTIAMDFWASLEHQMRYKQDDQNLDSIIEELSACAEEIHATDLKMQMLRDRIDALDNQQGEDEALFAKLAKLDICMDS
ncbi:MAG: GTP pyrophosphokinase family protein [Eubacteriales bacterium]|nr:GTP pyrophosphokinase family protein [Eubacteriales bacterium]